MMRTMHIPTLFVISLGLAACGGSNLDPGSGNSQGTGTRTLLVDGSVDASASIPNAGDATAFTTHFDVRLTKDQTPVTTGTVTVTSNGGDAALTLDTTNGGHWVGTQTGYFEVYQLDVTSGADTIGGVRVDGPDVHTFTAPALGATVDTSQPVAVTWSRDDHADVATIDTHNLDHAVIDDSGSYALAAGALRSSVDKTENDTIELRRTNQVTPAGAVAGSSLSVSVTNDVDVVVSPNPGA